MVCKRNLECVINAKMQMDRISTSKNPSSNKTKVRPNKMDDQRNRKKSDDRVPTESAFFKVYHVLSKAWSKHVFMVLYFYLLEYGYSGPTCSHPAAQKYIPAKPRLWQQILQVFSIWPLEQGGGFRLFDLAQV